ncbi:hypothetical protein RB653_002711 [Dictyostelium firmibasis]|uniref:Uncharacterized protein n=1 Tax=Dictyostelium firmibasis TaxID=79012 RepID=A0AAN7TYA2_9MYCE
MADQLNQQKQQRVINEIVQAEQQQRNNIIRFREKIQTFSNKDKKDCEIGKIFQLFEENNKHIGNVKDIGIRLSSHFNGEALTTFMNKYDNYQSYEEMKTYMLSCFDHHSIYSAEEQLDNLKDTHFKRFTEFLLKFERLKEKTNITDRRSIEILISAINNKNIKKHVFMKSPATLGEAFREAKLAALYEYKETGRLYYSPSSETENIKNNK